MSVPTLPVTLAAPAWERRARRLERHTADLALAQLALVTLALVVLALLGT